jgi:hypothetical protein
MIDPAARGRAVTRRRTLALIALAVALLAGCELVTGTVRTTTELQDAGIRNPNLQYNDGVATLDHDADPDPLEARAEQDRAAGVIWRNLPFRIDRITVASGAAGSPVRRDYPRALLEQQFGPRPANLDRSAADIARRAAIIAVVVSVVVLALVVLVIVLVVRAVRRRPAPQPAAAWPPGGPQPWGQPPPPGQPAWGQPTQQAQPPGQGRPPQPPPPPEAPREPPARGPGGTQRLEPEPPPPGDRGAAPPP